VTPGFSLVAAATTDHQGHPVAGLAVTYPAADPVDEDSAARDVRQTAKQVATRLSGRGWPAGCEKNPARRRYNPSHAG
jgi:DNA-binding IclR family transcriptional regulator